jgi:anti-sigma B factor antagonist
MLASLAVRLSRDGARFSVRVLGDFPKQPMNLDVRDDGRVTIIAVQGDLVIGEPETVFKKTVTRLLEEGKVQILVDCTALRIVDSSGLGALVRTLSTTQSEGGQTKLLGVGPHLLRLLDLTSLGSVFEIHTDRESAVASF